MKKLILAVALLVTASNLAVGVAYAAVCEGAKGGRACGTECSALANGACACTGSCSSDEMKWVAGAGGGSVAMLEEDDY
jgi:hypothetical protein